MRLTESVDDPNLGWLEFKRRIREQLRTVEKRDETGREEFPEA
jgi:hypothetical protein